MLSNDKWYVEIRKRWNSVPSFFFEGNNKMPLTARKEEMTLLRKKKICIVCYKKKKDSFAFRYFYKVGDKIVE